MVSSTVSLPAKWDKFLKQLADDHQVDLNSVISELCVWAFFNPEGKKQFKAWLDDAFPQKMKLKIKRELRVSEKERWLVPKLISVFGVSYFMSNVQA